MQAAAAPTNNPFPAEAVSTYGGARAVDVADLAYMRVLHDELSRYLAAYPRDDTRFGGAIGLRGGHGAGKTHVLGWLADTLRGTRAIGGTVLYAKCDSMRFFDLYRQLMVRLDRSALTELIQLALLNLARSTVRSAKITESLAQQLETAGSLQKLQAEQNLDLQLLRQQLTAELSTAGPGDLVRVLMDVTHPQHGDEAQRWLAGIKIDGLAKLGLSHQLSALPREDGADSANTANASDAPSGSGVIDADTNAITALAVIAALHRVAGVPLMVLVDQLEVLVGPGMQATETLGSLLKKFVEQFQGQAALAFIAGVPLAWRALPRDVPARFRRREPIIVGNLTVAETQVFLLAYTSQRPAQEPFSGASAEAMRELSGGSPRELLRIAHHAFEETAGRLSEADAPMLLRAASRSGSIDDRARLALAMVDTVFPNFGTLSHELAANDQRIADRALLDANGEMVVALLVVKATDALDEIGSARRVQTALAYQQAHWVRAELLVVAVGYSSAEVRDALRLETPPLVFDEKSFEAELRTHMVALAARAGQVPMAPAAVRTQAVILAPPAPPAPSPEADTVQLDALAEIAKRLEELERARSVEAERVQERFRLDTKELARPALEERRLTTRREILDALDSLEAALSADDSSSERKLLRSILVSNEAHLRDTLLDDLGELYLEVLALERFGPEDRAELALERDSLIRNMRSSVRRAHTAGATLFNAPRLLMLMGALFVAFVAFGMLSVQQAIKTGMPANTKEWWGLLPPPTDFISMLPFAAALFATLVGFACVAAWMLDRNRRRRLHQRIEELRVRAQDRAKADPLRNRYPQAFDTRAASADDGERPVRGDRST